jgi:hypothetical protein
MAVFKKTLIIKTGGRWIWLVALCSLLTRSYLVLELLLIFIADFNIIFIFLMNYSDKQSILGKITSITKNIMIN